MGSQRLSAKEAIEALKAHQLATVNKGILDEIRIIKEDLKIWKNQLDTTEKDVGELTEKSTELYETIQKHGDQHLQFENEHQSHARELRSLQTLYTALNEKVLELASLSTATKQQHESMLGELREEVERLNEKVKEFEASEAQTACEARLEVVSRARMVDFEQLEDRLDDFIQEVSTRFENLQRDMCVSDSSAKQIVHGLDEQNDVENASSLTNSAQFTTSPQPELNTDRWKPIDTQTALRATPPPLLETLPFATRREDSHVQTPSTFRSARPIREGISNIVHTKHVEGEQEPQVHKPQLSPTVAEIVSHKYTSRPEQGPGDWKMLDTILRLRQSTNESLSQYLARVEGIATKLGPNRDVISVCFRRFASGLKDERTKSFVHEWLMTSAWTIENVRDCILLLMTFSTLDLAGQARSVADRIQTVDGAEIDSYRHCHDEALDRHDTLQGTSNVNPEAVPLSRSQPKELKTVTEIVETQLRIQPTRTAKVRNVDKSKVSKGPRETGTKKISDTAGTGNRQHLAEEVAATAQNSKGAISDNVCGDVVAQPVASKRKTYRKAIGQNELKALLNTHAIEKPLQTPVTSLKRKTLHQTRAGTPQAKPTPQPESRGSLPKKLQLQNRRIPKLVPRSIVAKMTSKPETDGTMALPPIVPGFDGQEEVSDDERRATVARKRVRQSSPGLPILSLTASDFHE